jgi:hypothetical protein
MKSLTPEQLAQARKSVREESSRDNFMVIYFSYGVELLLPYKDGMAVMQAFQKAEMLNTPYGKPPSITGLTKDVQARPFSREDYEQIKMANLLNISLEELKQAMLPEPEEIT